MKIRKVFIVALIASICLSLYFSHAPASAEDITFTAQDGLCVHHPEHTQACGYYLETGEGTCTHTHDETCGYVSPVEEQPCTHTHDVSCGYAEAGEAVPCDQECTDIDGDGIVDHAEGCAYQPAVEEQPCTHVHDEACGYVPPVEGQPCTHIHDETCGYVDPAETGVCVYAQSGCPYCVVDWQWSDPQQMLTQEEDGSWSLYLPSVSASNPISRQGLQSFLPAEIAVNMEDTTITTIAIAWDLAAVPTDGAAAGDYLLEAYPADSTYALTETAPPLQATLRLGGAETYALEMPSGDPPFSEHIVTGVSPAGTTIDLFDYWITGQFDADNGDNSENKDKGINANHALLFTAASDNRQDQWNQWTRSSAPYSGIVDDELYNGYPKLSLDMQQASSVTSGRDGTESLAYLFDPNFVHEGKQSFRDVKGLLQVDTEGYYYYNSQQNYAVYYASENAFTLYEYPGVKTGGNSPDGQFFPFNAAKGIGESFINPIKSTDSSINHYFGLHMSTRFIQENEGHVSSAVGADPVTYEFSGDDDVWIFIDGTLVADLGGIHDAASVAIDFSTGVIEINGQTQSETLGDLLNTGSDTLPDNTYHTLDFFMLERGNVDSNLKLRYNLVTIPESSVIKVDQVGDPVPGAEFSLYAADNPDTPIATGTTNSNGEFVFVKKDTNVDRPITIQELYDTYKQTKDSSGNNLILKETYVPPGYRSNGDIGLYFYVTEYEEVLLLSNSTWDKGAYAMPKVTATVIGNRITLLENGTNNETDKEVDLKPEEKPLMFAVVYQKQEGNTWLPVSGDPLNGWTVHEDSSWGSVLAAARNNPYIFQLASSGAYQVEVSNLPGDIRKYYYICGSEPDAEYTIAYYYTEASTLGAATEDNTWRIASDQDELDRVFSVNLYVSNIKNRLLVQKVNEDGEVITEPGFQFTLYSSDQVTVTDDGTVTIEDENVYYDRLTTTEETSITNFNGGGIFPTAGKVLENGEYYLVETYAPDGYKKSEKITHIVVDHTGVYADAGEEGDGIVVLRGVGSIIHSMLQFAADDDVDTTLNHIKAALASATFDHYDAEGSFKVNEANWSSNSVLHLEYANKNEMLDYGLVGSNEPGMPDDLSIATDEGWSKLLIRQCDTHIGEQSGVRQDLGTQDITNLFSGTVTVRVTNERVGNLTISKEVISSSGETPPSDISFTFALKNQTGDAPITGTYETVDQDNRPGSIIFDANGEASLELKAGERLTILGLPYGSQYTVREVLQPGYNVSTSTDDGAPVEGTTVNGSIPHSTQENGDKTVVFTNDYDGQTRASINVQKTMLGRNIKQGETFEFTIEAHNDAAKAAVQAETIQLPGTLTLTGTGNATEMQDSFGMITFKNNPVGSVTYEFAIKEVIPQGATSENDYVSGGVSYDPHMAIVSVTVDLNTGTNKWVAQEPQYKNDNALTEADKQVSDAAAFTNTGAYDLTIAKQVTGEMGDRDKLFDFTITLPDASEKEYPFTLTDASGTEKKGTISLQNYKGNFQLSHGQKITIHGISVGTTYTIAEPGAQADGYSVTPSGSPSQVTIYNDGSCKGTLDQATTVTYTNQKATAVPTGNRQDTLPWLLALACGLGGCAALCVTGKIRRRKGGCGRTYG